MKHNFILSNQERRVIKLNKHYDMTEKEISEETGMPLQQVKITLMSAKKKLHNMIFFYNISV